MDQALQFLTRTQNSDGGLGYQAGGAGFTEPTGLALIALSGTETAAAARGAAGWLLATQHGDGGWGALHSDAESGWHTSVAVWGLTAAVAAGVPGELQAAVSRATGWLLANRSRSLPLPNPATKLQGDLAAWFGSVPAAPAACKDNALLGADGCKTNGLDLFDRVAFWRTPVADCGGGRTCTPYHEWVTGYVAVIGGR